MRTWLRMIVRVLLPRFSLLVALSGAREELVGRPVALAPELGRAQFIGETSPAARVHGVRGGVGAGGGRGAAPRARGRGPRGTGGDAAGRGNGALPAARARAARSGRSGRCVGARARRARVDR